MEFSFRNFWVGYSQLFNIGIGNYITITVVKFQLQYKVPAIIATEMVTTVANMKNGI